MQIVIKDYTGEVIASTEELELDEYCVALEVLSRPSMFGNSEYTIEEYKYKVIHTTETGVVFASDDLSRAGADCCLCMLSRGYGHGSIIIEDMTTGEIVNGTGFSRGEYDEL